MYVGKYDSIKKMKKTIGKDKGKKTDKISYWIKDLTDVLTILAVSKREPITTYPKLISFCVTYKSLLLSQTIVKLQRNVV